MERTNLGMVVPLNAGWSDIDDGISLEISTKIILVMFLQVGL